MLKKRSYLIILATAVIFALLLSSCNFNFGAPTVGSEEESFDTEDSSAEPSGETDEETEPEELSTEETDTTETEPESESETELESESESEPESESETEPVETAPVVSIEPVLPTAGPTPTPTTAPVCSHTFDSTVIREATCVSGLTRHACSKCGYSYDEETAPVARHFAGGSSFVSNGDGETHKEICSVCGYTEKEKCEYSWSTTVVTHEAFESYCNDCNQLYRRLEYRPIIQDAFRVLNEQRVAAGLNPVEYDYNYQDFADGRAKQIATVEFSHTGHMFAECIAKGPQTGRGVMVGGDFGPDTGWMGSTGHRNIIMDPEITHVTISMYGISNHNYKTGFEIYWVLMAHGEFRS